MTNLHISEGAKQLAVLAYHKIGEPSQDGWTTWYYIPTTTFVQQMQIIQESDWTVIDLSTVLAGLERPECLPDRGLLLTFDDGQRCMVSEALPVLQQFGFPAVCFVPTDHVGGESAFDEGVEPREPMCNWAELCELDRNGVSIQSHGTSHHWFSLLSPSQLDRELNESKRVVEQELGKPVEAIAFPYSDAGREMNVMNAALRMAGYRAGFLCGGGPSTNTLPLRDTLRIDRLAVYRDTNLLRELDQNPRGPQ